MNETATLLIGLRDDDVIPFRHQQILVAAELLLTTMTTHDDDSLMAQGCKKFRALGLSDNNLINEAFML